MEATSIQPNQTSDLSAVLDEWNSISASEKYPRFKELDGDLAEDFFEALSADDQAFLISVFKRSEKRTWLRFLAPDDVADVIQQFDEDEQSELLGFLDPPTRKEVIALLRYREDEAGGLMNPRFIRLRSDTPVDVAIRYLRAQSRRPIEVVQYAYVLDQNQRLIGVVSFRDLLLADDEKLVMDIMESELITIMDDEDQEEVSRIFAQTSLPALPVVDKDGVMKGVVTIDDVVDVVQEEATEDIQKLGGLEALDLPYFKTSFFEMIRKRAGWLTFLFLGEMLTATAMGHFEAEIERAVVLALFIPLIISSGGNSGSQATSLIIRALALGEIQLRDWWRVFMREVRAGLCLGAILGTIGLVRILLWPSRATIYGEHYALVGISVGLSLLGVVLWGSLAGSMLPFILKRLGFDPATSSAPFVATLVDVTGLVIYFSIASLMLKGTLL